ncbi:hypothetical protein R3P38DRAFT_3291175 [Favolaschia claudopus]|uniref:Uncharacterized protein n=1 Tax=Favolaschia claudopus TaxID=2862362 RepID=A0AAV9ZPD4_9AGAR
MRGEAPISTVSRAQKPPSTVKNRVRGTIVRRLAYCREGSDRRGEGCAKRVSRTCQRDKWTNRPNVVGARLQGKEYACLRIKREVVGGTVLRAIAATTFLLFFVTSAPPAHLDSLQQLQRRRRNLLTSLFSRNLRAAPQITCSRLAAPILHDHCVVRPLRRSFYLKPISTTRVLIRHHRFDGPSYLGCDHAASRKPIRATRYPNVEVLSRTGGRSGVDGAPSSKDPQ